MVLLYYTWMCSNFKLSCFSISVDEWSMILDQSKEFKFTDKDFKFIKNLVSAKTGIVLSDAKRSMVYSRLARRLRALSIESFSNYCDFLKTENEDELINFVNAITTNLTSFFREKHHFDYIAKTLIPHWLKTRNNERRIRIWSAGCSTGEEPYSIAITLQEHFPNIDDWDVKILATDLDTNVVATAKSGIYSEERIEGLPKSMVRDWFKKGSDSFAGKVKVSPILQEMITYNQLNLLQEWPFKGGFDLIFCRNVVIYFNKDTQRVLADRYADMLKNDGTLFLGHSETLFKVSDRFSLVGNTVYNKDR